MTIPLDHVKFEQRRDRTTYLVQRFRPYLQGAILDVGCGKAVLKQLLPDQPYTGVDVAGAPDVQLDLEKIERLPFDDAHFGCVVCTDVLEHLDNLHAIFAELLRVSSRYVIVALPNCWQVARVPISRGRGGFAHYGLPADRPADRHKWFFSYSQAHGFITEHLRRRPDWRLVDQRLCEKPRCPLIRTLRQLRYGKGQKYWNRYSHTAWFVLERDPDTNP